MLSNFYARGESIASIWPLPGDGRFSFLMEIENAEALTSDGMLSFGRRICKSAVEWVAKAVSKGPA